MDEKSIVSFDVRDPRMEEILRRLGTKIGVSLPSSWGFMLMLFEYGENGNLFYISSAEREDVIRVLESFIGREKIKRDSG